VVELLQAVDSLQHLFAINVRLPAPEACITLAATHAKLVSNLVARGCQAAVTAEARHGIPYSIKICIESQANAEDNSTSDESDDDSAGDEDDDIDN
jgi:hypothetical protein